MEKQKLIQQFARFKLYLRPEALDLLINLKLKSDKILEICSKMQKMDLGSKVIESIHIEQILQIGQICSQNENSIIEALRQYEKTSIVIINSFEDDHRYIFQADVQDKIDMYINRLENIENILKKDERYCFNQQQYEEKQILIQRIGSVIGRQNQNSLNNILGILILLNEEDYHLTDGQISVKLNLSNYKHTNLYNPNLSEGLINIGQVIIVQGRWDEQISAFSVQNISLPFVFLNINQQNQYYKFKNNQRTSSPDILDLASALLNDEFGAFKRINEIFKIKYNLKQLKVEQQRALCFFPVNKKINDTKSWWFISNFAMDNILTTKRLNNLFETAQQNQQSMNLPSAIFIQGQFFQSRQNMRANDYGTEILQTFQRYQSLFQNTNIYLQPSYDDPLMPNSLPHSAISANLLFGKQEHQIPQNIHTISNPVKINFCGYKAQIIRNDISRELRKNNINSFAKFNIEEICDTILSQRYLSHTSSSQSMVKWNYSKNLWIPMQTQLIVLADVAMEQFIFKNQLGHEHIINPGNFSVKGEFIIMDQVKDNVSFHVSKVD